MCPRLRPSHRPGPGGAQAVGSAPGTVEPGAAAAPPSDATAAGLPAPLAGAPAIAPPPRCHVSQAPMRPGPTGADGSAEGPERWSALAGFCFGRFTRDEGDDAAASLADFPLFGPTPASGETWRRWTLILDGILDPFADCAVALRWSVEATGVHCRLWLGRFFDTQARARQGGAALLRNLEALVSIHAPDLIPGTLEAPHLGGDSDPAGAVRWVGGLVPAVPYAAAAPNPLGPPTPTPQPNLRSVVACLRAMGVGTQLQLTLTGGLRPAPAPSAAMTLMEGPNRGEYTALMLPGSGARRGCGPEPSVARATPARAGASLQTHLLAPQRPDDALLRALRTSLGAIPGTPRPTAWELRGDEAAEAGDALSRLWPTHVLPPTPGSALLPLAGAARRIPWPSDEFGLLNFGTDGPGG